MIKLILSGLWVCLVTLASTYAAVSWLAPRAPEPETQTQKLQGGLESVKTRMISVPVVADGAITASCSVADFAVFEQDRNGDAIDFWLDHHWNFLMWEQTGDTRVKFG